MREINPRRPGMIYCFGEVLARLSTGAGTPLAASAQLSVHIGGSESNVAAMLAQLGHDVEMLTALPDSALGELCLTDLRRHGIGTRKLLRADGRLGLYFFEPNGSGGGRIIYDRKQTVFVAEAGAFLWRDLATTASWFHLTGICLALGGLPASAAVCAVEAMNAAGVPVSFDVNHRASLWEERSAAELSAVRNIAAMADVLFASQLDIGRLIGIPVPDERDGRAAADAAFSQFDHVQQIASTSRKIDHGNQQLVARCDTRDDCYETNPAALGKIIDRVGSGDAFAGAVIDAIFRNSTPEQCALAGLAAAVMKHGISGDRWIGTREELDSFDPFQSRDIKR